MQSWSARGLRGRPQRSNDKSRPEKTMGGINLSNPSHNMKAPAPVLGRPCRPSKPGASPPPWGSFFWRLEPAVATSLCKLCLFESMGYVAILAGLARGPCANLGAIGGLGLLVIVSRSQAFWGTSSGPTIDRRHAKNPSQNRIRACARREPLIEGAAPGQPGRTCRGGPKRDPGRLAQEGKQNVQVKDQIGRQKAL